MAELGVDLGLEPGLLIRDAVRVLLAFALAFPIAWERGRSLHSPGFRTLPIVAMASCGFALIIVAAVPTGADAHARVMQGVISGIGFVGGGAILKNRGNVHGLATAASIWNAGAIGLAVGFGRTNIALVLSAINFATLVLLSGRAPRATREPAQPSAQSPRRDI